MSLSKYVKLTISDYSMKLSSNLNFYVNDCLDLIFELNKWGVDNKNSSNVGSDSSFDLTGISAQLFIENSKFVDYIEATKIEDNKIIFRLTNKYTILSGTGRMQIRLVDDDGCELKLPAFSYNIQPTINELNDKNPNDELILVSEKGSALLNEDGQLFMMSIKDVNNNPNLIKISDLPEADSVSYEDYMIVNNQGVTKKVPVRKIKISEEQIANIAKVPTLTEQLETKANKSTTDNIQQQVNNLVLGAVGDGNNAEVVQARDTFNTLNDRLSAIQSFIMKQSENLFNINKCLLNTSLVTWGTPTMGVNDTYSKDGYECSSAIPVIEGETYYWLTINKDGQYDKGTINIVNKYDVDGNFLGTFSLDKNGYTGEKDVSFLRLCKIGSFDKTNQFKVSTADLTKFEDFGYYSYVVSNDMLKDKEKDINKELRNEIKELNRRITALEKLNGFTFKKFDKTYFAFVFDDAYSNIVTQYQYFKNKGIVLSTAVIVENLKNSVIKNTVDTIVADGGEVLSHYNIDLTAKTEDDLWRKNTRDVKHKLEEYGYNVRGVIRANSSDISSDLGEMYCRLYFDYSDGLGKSQQYKLTRKFVKDFSTVEDFKAYIDTCCITPGFYPICLHGTEPICTENNINTILDYIIAKGTNVCQCTTYSNIIDTFGTTIIEKRLNALENN